MVEKIKCPWCDHEFDVKLPDEIEEGVYYEGEVRCENCNNMVKVFTKPQMTLKPIDN